MVVFSRTVSVVFDRFSDDGSAPGFEPEVVVSLFKVVSDALASSPVVLTLVSFKARFAEVEVSTETVVGSS